MDKLFEETVRRPTAPGRQASIPLPHRQTASTGSPKNSADFLCKAISPGAQVYASSRARASMLFWYLKVGHIGFVPLVKFNTCFNSEGAREAGLMPAAGTTPAPSQGRLSGARFLRGRQQPCTFLAREVLCSPRRCKRPRCRRHNVCGPPTEPAA